MADLFEKSQQELLSPWNADKACALSSIFSSRDTSPPDGIDNDLCEWFNERQDCETLCFADIALFNLLQDAENKAFKYILATHEGNEQTYDRIIQNIANFPLALSKEFVEGLCQVNDNNYCVPQYYFCKKPSSAHDTNTQSSEQKQKEFKVWIKDFQSSPNPTPDISHSKAEDLAKKCADIFFENPLTDQSGQEMKVVYFIPLAPARTTVDRPIPLGQFFIGFSDDDTQTHKGLIRDIVLFIYYQYSSLATAKVANDKNKQMKKLFSDLMRTTSRIDVFARMFAISLDAFDDFKDFREKLGFISYEFLSQDKKGFSFVLVPKQSQGTGYYYSNYDIPDNSCQRNNSCHRKKYFAEHKKGGKINNEVEKCFKKLGKAWLRPPTNLSNHPFQQVIFADINENENDNRENSSSNDENIQNYKNTIASIIGTHSISRAIKNNHAPQGTLLNLNFDPVVATKDHKFTYTPYAYWDKRCAVVSGFRNDNDLGRCEQGVSDEQVVSGFRNDNELRMIITIGMKKDYFNCKDDTIIKGLIEKIWEHQLRCLAESMAEKVSQITIRDIAKEIKDIISKFPTDSNNVNVLLQHNGIEENIKDYLSFSKDAALNLSKDETKALFMLYDAAGNIEKTNLLNNKGIWYIGGDVRYCLIETFVKITQAFLKDLLPRKNIKINYKNKKAGTGMRLPRPGIIFILNLVGFISRLYVDKEINTLTIKMTFSKGGFCNIKLMKTVNKIDCFDAQNVVDSIFDFSKPGDTRLAARDLIIMSPHEELSNYYCKSFYQKDKIWRRAIELVPSEESLSIRFKSEIVEVGTESFD